MLICINCRVFGKNAKRVMEIIDEYNREQNLKDQESKIKDGEER